MIGRRKGRIGEGRGKEEASGRTERHIPDGSSNLLWYEWLMVLAGAIATAILAGWMLSEAIVAYLRRMMAIVH